MPRSLAVTFSQHFLSGEYTVRVETTSGYKGEATFAAAPSTSRPDTVDVWLKK